MYLQSVIQPNEKIEFRIGARYDRHAYPLSATNDTAISQLSPRFRVNFFPDGSNTIMLYYGRLFVPTNTEDLRAITSAATGGAAGEPTVPERADFFEVSFIHRFPSGVVSKLSAYRKNSSPGIDDTQLPGSAITTDVNIGQVHVTGIEAVIEVRPSGPLSGFLNLALIHAYGTGAITGGFLNETPPAQPFDLDHDQRLSSVLGLTYSTGRFWSPRPASTAAGSPTASRRTRRACRATIRRSIPRRCSAPACSPSTRRSRSTRISSGMRSVGVNFRAGNTTIRPQFFVDNVFDRKYVLKGAFFSGASYGRPRTFSVRISVGI